MPNLKSATGHRLARIGTVLGVTAAVLAATATAGHAANPVALTLSASQGPSAGGNTLTGTTVVNSNGDGRFATGAAAEFQYIGTGAAATCSGTYSAAAAIAVTSGTQTAGVVTVPAGGFKLLTANKIAVTVPSGLALGTGQTTGRYNLCVYAGTTVASTGVTGSALIASAAYSIAQKATISPNGISPATGPALGGTAITVTGSNFPTAVTTPPALTATLGGMPLLSIVVTSSTTFTAVTPPHAAGGPFLLVVTTGGGSTSTTTGTTRALLFTYTNGIVIAPNTSPNSRAAGTDVDVQGVGFAGLNFAGTTGATPDDTNAHVYLVRGAYNPAPTSAHGSTKTLGESQECLNVLVVSDTELVCTLTTTGSLTSAGVSATASRTVTDAVTATSTALTSATAAFSATDVGLGVTGTGIAAGTTIASVTNATTVVLSAATTASATGVSVTIGTHTVSDGVTTSGANTLSSATAAFTSADVGRVVSGTGIPVGTTIASVTSGTAVVLSANATATGTGVSVSFGNPVPVPVGTYTLTVVSNGLADVLAGGDNEDATFTQSLITSGSTFTVADY